MAAWYEEVHSEKKFRLGTRKRSVNNKEFIYLSGVSSLVAEDVVVFDESFATTRAIADEVGPVAVAMAAVDATTEYGWFQIYGVATVDAATTVAADKQLFLTSTAGRVDDADVAGDAIIGMYSMAAAASNSMSVWLNYPHVADTAHD